MKMGGVLFAKTMLHYGYINNVEEMKQKVVCMFHPDLRPSMLLDLNKGTYYCFGCNVSGNVLDFIMHHDNLTELKAYQKLAKINSDPNYKDINFLEDNTRYQHREIDKEAIAEAKYLYDGLIQNDWTEIRPGEAENAIQYLLQRGFTRKFLTAMGCRYTYDDNYKLIFPILDNGDFRGWLRRTTLKEVEQYRKYLYNKGFSRANMLCGTYDNKHIVYICEGYMDMMSLKQYGVYCAVAIFGWKITREQVKKLKDAGINHVISVLDNDKCGRDGTKELARHFTVTRFMYLEGFKDPNDMSKDMFRAMNNKTLQYYKQREIKQNGRNESIPKNEKASGRSSKQQRRNRIISR